MVIMIKILIKHVIYEVCLEVIFTGAHANFQKPISEKKQIIGKMVASILFNARIHDRSKLNSRHYAGMIVDKLSRHISDEIDEELLNKMIDSKKSG